MESNGLSVYVVVGAGHDRVKTIFKERGYNICYGIDFADIVVFTGGVDVCPIMYGHHTHKTTRFDMHRDNIEKNIYERALEMGLPMIGICRGAQFLNVMNGGTLYQDVDNHAISDTHTAYLVPPQKEVQVTSTHHQMMQPNYKVPCIIPLVAAVASYKDQMSPATGPKLLTVTRAKDPNAKTDVEAVYYDDNECLCFQPHPENGHKETEEVFFHLVDNYIVSNFDTEEEKESA